MSGIVLLVLRAAMTIALYAFLGWALWLLWRDLKNQQNTLVAQQITPLNVVIEIDSAKRKQEFSSPEIIIGRDPTVQCVIDSKTVSTHHARLNFDRGQWWVEDLESTNGTLLNQERVSIPTVVTPGDQLRCGETTITIEE
ncbi:MAG: FHA domain-containing protein [Anaerolineales bacterium]|nr:FHA domain-containing protein [Chloroflexota bacterium]MBL6979622.1 FHA domain-containing protein [Anaerolineales bacterium]